MSNTTFSKLPDIFTNLQPSLNNHLLQISQWIQNSKINLPPNFSLDHFSKWIQAIPLLPLLKNSLQSLPTHFFKIQPHLPIILPTAFISYLLLVRLLRYRAINTLLRTHSQYLSVPYSMPYPIAHQILHLALLHDFPFLHFFSTQWALIKTYGIASGTPLLCQTSQLTSPSTVGRRAEDTGVMITEFLIGDMDSERGRLALGKMNWLHGRYGNRILKQEMLYTLSVFILEPIRWINLYEWRKLEEVEEVALFVYWREIGRRMGIPGELMPGTLEELREWAKGYEETDMYFVEENRKCAEASVGLFVRGVPWPLKGVVRRMVSVFLEPKVRKATGVEEPQWWAGGFVNTVFYFRKLGLRYLALPRWKSVDPLPKFGRDGRLRRDPALWGFEPWYVDDGLWTRVKIFVGSGGRLWPGRKWRSNGYLPEEIGPEEYVGVSKVPVRKEAERLKEFVGGGCPMR